MGIFDSVKKDIKPLDKKAMVPQNTEIEFDFSVEDIVLMGRTPLTSRYSSSNRNNE